MVHRVILDFISDHEYFTAIGFLIFTGTVLAALAPIFSEGSVVGGADNMISYCGTPNYFDQFQEQNGYTPNAQCTGVEIAGFRIDTEKTSWTNGNWGCGGSVTVYKVQDNGDLNQVADTGESKSSPDDITVGDLTIEPISQTSGLSFYNCEYVANSYEYSFGGNLDMTASTPEDAYKKEELPVNIQFHNRYDGKVAGETTVEFCSTGAFGLNRCVTRSASVDLQPGEQAMKALKVPNENVGDVVKVSSSFDGSLHVSGWERVNVDCDGDSRIERIEDCSGFPVTASKDLQDIRMQPPVEVQDIVGPRTVEPGENVTYTANVSNFQAVSPDLTWSNGDTGRTATYSWDTTGNKTVTLTVDDGFNEETTSIEVRVEQQSILDGVFGFLESLWGFLSYGG